MIKCDPNKDGTVVKVTFILEQDSLDGRVAVVGDFSDWDATAVPMAYKGGKRVATVALVPGRRYGFRYLTEQRQWLNDEAADAYEPNKSGVENSIRCRRSNTSLVIGFVDVDGLKAVNTPAGHQAGDQLLKDVATGLRAVLRSYDVVVRFGGDEFVFSLAGAGLAAAAARFEKMLASLARLNGDSVSAGFGELAPAETLETLIERADKDLYQRRGAARDGR